MGRESNKGWKGGGGVADSLVREQALVLNDNGRMPLAGCRWVVECPESQGVHADPLEFRQSIGDSFPVAVPDDEEAFGAFGNRVVVGEGCEVWGV